jgi:nickel-type superoxide dismutase maturation protease
MGLVWGITSVAVAGNSMEPALKSGDWWLVRKTQEVRPGQIVAFWEPNRVDLLAVKRVDHEVAGSWWMLGDNLQTSIDSRSFGPVQQRDIVGRLVFRFRPVFRKS